jgi:NADH-quinone oxidoreductase subunit I
MEKLGAGKHGGVSEFTMDLGRCMFCNLCIEACPFDAIYMGPVYELASYERNASVFHIADLAQGGAAAVETNIKTITDALAAEAAEKAAKAAAAGGHGEDRSQKTEVRRENSASPSPSTEHPTPNAQRLTPSTGEATA